MFPPFIYKVYKRNLLDINTNIINKSSNYKNVIIHGFTDVYNIYLLDIKIKQSTRQITAILHTEIKHINKYKNK